MASAMLTKLAFLLVFSMVVETLVTPRVVEAVIPNCGTVDKSLGQCMTYLKGAGGARPPGPCCNGIRILKAAAQNTADKRMACNCMKTAASKTKGLNHQRVASVARLCGVRINYAFDPKINCNTVQ